MKKTFHTYIKKYQFHPFERLFDESIREFVKTEYTERISAIYAIVETDKVSFLPETFEATGNYCISGKIMCGDRVEPVIFNVPKTWYFSESELSKNFQNNFQSYEKFLDFHMSQYHNPQYPYLSNSEKYCSLLEIDIEKSSESVLFVKCPIASAGNAGNPAYAELYSYQTLNFFDAECIGNLDILYIGKSTSSTFDRLKNHEKWGPIMASKSEQKDYLVYFFEIDDHLLLEQNFADLRMRAQASNKIPKDAIVKLCEASLINHYKPKFNKDHTESLIEESKIVKKWLRSNDYNELYTEVELEGLMGRLSTKFQAFKQRHAIQLPLKSSNKQSQVDA